jgi:hypothetical protein
LGQSQVSCAKIKLAIEVGRGCDATDLSRHPAPERKRKTSERPEPQPGRQVGNSDVGREWNEQMPEPRWSSRWKR